MELRVLDSLHPRLGILFGTLQTAESIECSNLTGRPERKNPSERQGATNAVECTLKTSAFAAEKHCESKGHHGHVDTRNALRTPERTPRTTGHHERPTDTRTPGHQEGAQNIRRAARTQGHQNSRLSVGIPCVTRLRIPTCKRGSGTIAMDSGEMEMGTHQATTHRRYLIVTPM